MPSLLLSQTMPSLLLNGGNQRHRRQRNTALLGKQSVFEGRPHILLAADADADADTDTDTDTASLKSRNSGGSVASCSSWKTTTDENDPQTKQEKNGYSSEAKLSERVIHVRFDIHGGAGAGANPAAAADVDLDSEDGSNVDSASFISVKSGGSLSSGSSRSGGSGKSTIIESDPHANGRCSAGCFFCFFSPLFDPDDYTCCSSGQSSISQSTTSSEGTGSLLSIKLADDDKEEREGGRGFKEHEEEQGERPNERQSEVVKEEKVVTEEKVVEDPKTQISTIADAGSSFSHVTESEVVITPKSQIESQILNPLETQIYIGTDSLMGSLRGTVEEGKKDGYKQPDNNASILEEQAERKKVKGGMKIPRPPIALPVNSSSGAQPTLAPLVNSSSGAQPTSAPLVNSSSGESQELFTESPLRPVSQVPTLQEVDTSLFGAKEIDAAASSKLQWKKQFLSSLQKQLDTTNDELRKYSEENQSEGEDEEEENEGIEKDLSGGEGGEEDNKTEAREKELEGEGEGEDGFDGDSEGENNSISLADHSEERSNISLKSNATMKRQLLKLWGGEIDIVNSTRLVDDSEDRSNLSLKSNTALKRQRKKLWGRKIDSDHSSSLVDDSEERSNLSLKSNDTLERQRMKLWGRKNNLGQTTSLVDDSEERSNLSLKSNTSIKRQMLQLLKKTIDSENSTRLVDESEEKSKIAHERQMSKLSGWRKDSDHSTSLVDNAEGKRNLSK